MFSRLLQLQLPRHACTRVLSHQLLEARLCKLWFHSDNGALSGCSQAAAPSSGGSGVQVRPAWRHTNIRTVSNSGALSSFWVRKIICQTYTFELHAYCIEGQHDTTTKLSLSSAPKKKGSIIRLLLVHDVHKNNRIVSNNRKFCTFLDPKNKS